jgi:two-component system CheB/CheR fusion protein
LAGRYLQQPGGEPTNNILRRILPALRLELTTILYRAFQKDKASATKPIRVIVDGEAQYVSLKVYAATDQALKGFALVVFDEVEVVDDDGEQRPVAMTGDATMHELENELEQTKRRLQTTIEEFETSKEEMKATNEELLSMNEELRSTAEELETSKEELQSMNEELITLNQENKNKVEELSRMTSDLQNLLIATDIATLFLDRELRIKRFTPQVSELFNILHSDRGRPLAHLTHKLGYDNLLEDAAKVLRTLIPIRREVQSRDGRWYLTRFLPYRTAEDRIDGVVITFVDVDEWTRAQQELERRVEQQAAVTSLSRLALEGVEQNTLFEQATRQLCETLGIQFCEVLNLEAEPETLHFKAGYGWDKKLIGQRMSPAKPKSPALYNLETKVPVLVEDWSEEKRFQPPDYAAEQGVVSTVSVVIPGLQHPYGVLRAHSTEKHTFSGDEVAFFQAVAHLLAEAIERKESEERLRALNETLEQRVEQRTEQVRSLASELIVTEQRVRQRISQVLHADLQQLIFAAQMNLKLMEQALSPEEHGAALAELQQTRSMVDEALRLSRQLTLDLSPPVLQNEDLGEALQWLVRHMQELHKLNVDLQIGDIPALPSEDMSLLLFQIVRELLFNVVKHAGVPEAQVKVFGENNHLFVQVIDEGAGFDVPAALGEPSHDGGYGLLNMGERLGLFGSTLNVRSEPGKGTTVTVVIPQLEDEPPPVSYR